MRRRSSDDREPTRAGSLMRKLSLAGSGPALTRPSVAGRSPSPSRARTRAGPSPILQMPFTASPDDVSFNQRIWDVNTHDVKDVNRRDVKPRDGSPRGFGDGSAAARDRGPSRDGNHSPHEVARSPDGMSAHSKQALPYSMPEVAVNPRKLDVNTDVNARKPGGDVNTDVSARKPGIKTDAKADAKRNPPHRLSLHILPRRDRSVSPMARSPFTHSPHTRSPLARTPPDSNSPTDLTYASRHVNRQAMEGATGDATRHIRGDFSATPSTASRPSSGDSYGARPTSWDVGTPSRLGGSSPYLGQESDGNWASDGTASADGSVARGGGASRDRNVMRDAKVTRDEDWPRALAQGSHAEDDTTRTGDVHPSPDGIEREVRDARAERGVRSGVLAKTHKTEKRRNVNKSADIASNDGNGVTRSTPGSDVNSSSGADASAQKSDTNVNDNSRATVNLHKSDADVNRRKSDIAAVYKSLEDLEAMQRRVVAQLAELEGVSQFAQSQFTQSSQSDPQSASAQGDVAAQLRDLGAVMLAFHELRAPVLF